MVEGLCRSLLRDRSDCEDAAQQTFLSAYCALLNGVRPREPAAWLAAIARNECLARIRDRMRRPLPVAELEQPRAELPDALAEAVRRADLAALCTAIATLPRAQRDALLMREFAGLRYDELAVALGVSEPAVESLLFRARARLRAALQPAFALVSLPFELRELLARLADAGAAAKVGTATVGIVVAAGGATVVAPRVEEHRHPRLVLAAPARAHAARPRARAHRSRTVRAPAMAARVEVPVSIAVPVAKRAARRSEPPAPPVVPVVRPSPPAPAHVRKSRPAARPPAPPEEAAAVETTAPASVPAPPEPPPDEQPLPAEQPQPAPQPSSDGPDTVAPNDEQETAAPPAVPDDHSSERDGGNPAGEDHEGDDSAGSSGPG